MSTENEIIVVGGGIAGLTAGLTAARLGRRTTVLTGDTLGGHLLSIERIDGYPGFPEGAPGYDLCPATQEQAAEAGAEFAMEPVSDIVREGDLWHVKTAGGSIDAKAVILATGTKLRNLDVPGEALLRGKGVSQCASCDAPLLGGKPVVVAGGGDSAVQEALTLADHCSTVTIVHRGDALTAQRAYLDQLEQKTNVAFEADSEISEILGDGAVTGVRIQRLASDDTATLECASVFVFVGLEPATAGLVDPALLDAHGYIVTDGCLRTTELGLFAAGTVRAGSTARAATAAGEGAAAAVAADAFLETGLWG